MGHGGTWQLPVQPLHQPGARCVQGYGRRSVTASPELEIEDL